MHLVQCAMCLPLGGGRRNPFRTGLSCSAELLPRDTIVPPWHGTRSVWASLGSSKDKNRCCMAVDSRLKYETEWEDNAGIGTKLDMPSVNSASAFLAVDKPCHGLLFLAIKVPALHSPPCELTHWTVGLLASLRDVVVGRRLGRI